MTQPRTALQVVTRFAPSPTGYMHLGHAYAAIFAWNAARERNGRFLLRIEDISKNRNTLSDYLAHYETGNAGADIIAGIAMKKEHGGAALSCLS